MTEKHPLPLYDFHQNYLNSLSQSSQRRQLQKCDGLSFSSNDYLGLANSSALLDAAKSGIEKAIPIGSGGSRLLSGNHEEHSALETEAAIFFKAQSALYFANGYAANMAVLSTLPQKGDMIFYDDLIHASSHDGMRLARCAAQSFAHNDVQDLQKKVKAWRAKNPDNIIWILFESFYSMDGDIAPIDAIDDLANEYDAIMVIDEAHACGVFGPDGRGLAAHLDGRDNVIILRTCGKAMGSEGALLCLPSIAKEFLINRARHFIFSTAPSPLITHIVRAALRIMQAQPERREALMDLCNYAGEKLSPLGAITHGGPIIPIIIGDAKRTVDIAIKLQDAGFDVRAIRPPTVAEGSSRLRICISLNIDKADIDKLALELRKTL